MCVLVCMCMFECTYTVPASYEMVSESMCAWVKVKLRVKVCVRIVNVSAECVSQKMSYLLKTLEPIFGEHKDASVPHSCPPSFYESFSLVLHHSIHITYLPCGCSCLFVCVSWVCVFVTHCGRYVLALLHDRSRVFVGRHRCRCRLVLRLSWLLFKPGRDTKQETVRK